MAHGRRSTAESVTAGIDLTGKTAVITGVNSGLGYESMRVLASRGARVIGLARTREKADAACTSVEGDCHGLACELSDLDSVRECAQQIVAMGTTIDVLMTNAGIMAPRQLDTINGVEMQFAINHLGHFLLVHHLLDQVKAASGRIVILSSAAHTMPVSGGIDFENLDGAMGYSPWRFYGQSKLANLLHARELHRRLRGTGVTVNALHPGVIKTNLGRDAGGFLMVAAGLLALPFMKNVGQGAATQCYLAVHPDLDDVSGRYFADCTESKPSAWGRDDALAAELWDHTEQLLGSYLG